MYVPNYLILIAFLLLGNAAEAQFWLISGSGMQRETANDIVCDNQGNVYTVGNFMSAVAWPGASMSSEGAEDGYLIKYNSDGVFQWQVTFSGQGIDNANGVALMPDGSLIVCGTFYNSMSAGALSATSQGDISAFVAKVSPEGIVQWIKSAGGDGIIRARQVAVDSQGNIAVVGEFSGSADFAAINISATGSTMDIFIAQLNASGTWQWAKAGHCDGENDIGKDVAVDANNDIIIVGNFSSDITFDSLLESDGLNVGLVTKFSQSGGQLEKYQIQASEIACNSVAADGFGNYYVAGKSQGVVQVNPGFTQTAQNAFSFFVAKFNSTSHMWTMENGSSDDVLAESITVSDDGQSVFVAGKFKCKFNQYAESEAHTPFISSGYFDVFIASIAVNDQHLIWSRQYGGPQEDNANGIDIASDGNVVFCGDYERFFHVPYSINFIPLATSSYWYPDYTQPLVYPNQGNSLCGYDYYGTFQTIRSAGNIDAYIAKAVDLTAAPFDIYQRTICGVDPVNACVVSQLDITACTTNVEGCGYAGLLANTSTGSDSFVGPAYTYSWSNGAHAPGISVTQNGTYSVSISREDGCLDPMNASVSVQINPIPVADIVVSGGSDVEFDGDYGYYYCPPGSLQFTGNTPAGQWVYPDSTTNSAYTITTNQDGVYYFSVTNNFGCTALDSVLVQQSVQPITANPQFEVNYSGWSAGDTVQLCAGSSLNLYWFDANGHPFFDQYSGAVWSYSINGGPEVSIGVSSVNYGLIATQPGTYTITSEPFIFNASPCPVDTIWFDPESVEVIIDVLPTPDIQVLITGNGILCPGDIAVLHATGGVEYFWSGPGIVNLIDSATVEVATSGIYSVASTVTNPNGCFDSSESTFTVNQPATPQVTSTPSHDYICPNQSVSLTCSGSGSFEWYSDGVIVGNSQTLVVTAPGTYYCNTSNQGCPIATNTIEIFSYATPSMISNPNDLCVNGIVQLCVGTYESAQFNWQSPLQGSSRCIEVTEPGSYTVAVVACDITTIITVPVVETVIEPVITVSPNVLCHGDSIQLSGNLGLANYIWSPDMGNDQTINVFEPGTYQLTVVDSNGCTFSGASYYVSEINNDSPMVSDETICAGESITFSGFEQPMTWSTSSDFSANVTQSNSIQFQNVLQEFTLYYYDMDSICRSPIDSVSINFYPSSMVDILQVSDSICAGGILEFNASCENNLGVNFLWTLPNGENQDGPTLLFPNSNEAPSGWFVVQTSDEHCDTGIDSVFMFLEYPHTVGIFSNDSAGVCVASDILLQPDIELNAYTWITPQGVSDEQSIAIVDAASVFEGDYIILAEGQICETITDTIELQVVDYPVVELNDSTVYCTSGYLIAHVTAGYDEYEWSNGDSDENAVVPLDGFLSVIITNWPGCSVSDDYQTTTVPCVDEFPNIFSPNGDGLNDELDFGLLRLPIEHVHIYNRWGDLIKDLSRSALRWNGRNENNELVSDGVYYWMIALQGPNLTQAKLEGYVHLLH